jgi:hypothetical protein
VRRLVGLMWFELVFGVLALLLWGSLLPFRC